MADSEIREKRGGPGHFGALGAVLRPVAFILNETLNGWRILSKYI